MSRLKDLLFAIVGVVVIHAYYILAFLACLVVAVAGLVLLGWLLGSR